MHAAAGQIDLFTRRTRRPPPAAEFATHCMVADTLRRWSNPDWRWTHIGHGEHRTPMAASRLKRLGLMPGWPDFLLLSPTGIAHCLELKRRGTGRLSDAQVEFGTWARAHGVPFVIARDFDAALAQLQAWGAVPSTIRVSA
jgi:hypothetical protein